MQNNLASDILHEVKKKVRIWQIATIVSLTVALVEFIAIIF